MNGVHDMGGMAGLGPLAPEQNEPVFHHEWERRVFALAMAAPIGGLRRQQELISGARYLSMSYYERWLEAVSASLVKGGAVTPGELASGRAGAGATRTTPRLAPEAVTAALTTRRAADREIGAPPTFQVGQKVRARNIHPTGHTRLPRYVRGRLGVVERWHGAHLFPDARAQGGGEDPRHLYTVRFTARELWGPDAPARDSVSLDLWEPYLERA